MKALFSLVMACFLTLSVVDSVEAKRFGSGGFGKSFKTSPFKKASPATPSKSTPAANKAADGKSKKGGLLGGGLLGGLLAGGLFAYLLGSGAFEGLQMMDILLMAGLAFVLFKLFAGKRRTAAAGAYGQSYGAQGQVQQRQGQNFSAGMHHDIPMEFPQGFDVKGFASGSTDHYRQVQQAWDDGDMSVIEEYLHPSLFAQLKQQRDAMAGRLHHEILDLSAEIVRSERISEGHSLSVLFKGRLKDHDTHEEAGIFDVWHLERLGDGPWLIIGIEAQ